jgi:hypothetical protein
VLGSSKDGQGPLSYMQVGVPLTPSFPLGQGLLLAGPGAAGRSLAIGRRGPPLAESGREELDREFFSWGSPDPCSQEPGARRSKNRTQRVRVRDEGRWHDMTISGCCVPTYTRQAASMYFVLGVCIFPLVPWLSSPRRIIA